MEAKNILQVSLTDKKSMQRCFVSPIADHLPTTYNFRESFKDCAKPIYQQGKSIKLIIFKGKCASSYAIAAASSFSDRKCRVKPSEALSPSPLINCENYNQKCKGGHLNLALDQLKKKGTVE